MCMRKTDAKYHRSVNFLKHVYTVYRANTQLVHDIFAERVRNISAKKKKIWDPAGIQTQDLLNTSQMLLPLSHLDPWQRCMAEEQKTSYIRSIA